MQNHLLQVLLFVAMDAPESLKAEAIQERKLELLKSIRTIRMKDALLGQFSARTFCRYCKETKNPGYLDDETVPKGSKVRESRNRRLNEKNNSVKSRLLTDARNSRLIFNRFASVRIV